MIHILRIEVGEPSKPWKGNKYGETKSIFAQSQINSSENNDAIFTKTGLGGFLSGAGKSNLQRRLLA